VDGAKFVVDAIEWSVFTKGDNPERYPQDWYPQQCATVRLVKARAMGKRRR
jgi:hypothetical protein